MRRDVCLGTAWSRLTKIYLTDSVLGFRCSIQAAHSESESTMSTFYTNLPSGPEDMAEQIERSRRSGGSGGLFLDDARLRQDIDGVLEMRGQMGDGEILISGQGGFHDLPMLRGVVALSAGIELAGQSPVQLA